MQVSVRFLLVQHLAARMGRVQRATYRSPWKFAAADVLVIHVKMAKGCNRYPRAASELFNHGPKREDNEQDP